MAKTNGIFSELAGYAFSLINKTNPIKQENNDGEIYRIWFDNDQTGKCYVGQTVQGSLNRIRQHIDDAQHIQQEGGCPLLDEATRYYGINHMRYEILASGVKTHEELDTLEKYYIKQYNSQSPNGYNVKSGGQHNSTGYTPINDKHGYKLSQRNPIAAAIVDEAINASRMNSTAKSFLRGILR
jgi:hypothetical protein